MQFQEEKLKIIINALELIIKGDFRDICDNKCDQEFNTCDAKCEKFIAERALREISEGTRSKPQA